MPRDRALISRDKLVDWTEYILSMLVPVMSVEDHANSVLIMDHLIEAELRLYGDKEDV